MPDTSDLYTKVKNTSGAARYFPYLNRHGVELADNEVYEVAGRLEGQFGWTRSKQESFERDILSGDITVLSLPRPIILDSDPDPAYGAPSTTATVVTNGGGTTAGLLAAGHYRVAYTVYNEWGETPAGGISADFTVPYAITNPTTTATVNVTGGGASGGNLVAGHYRVSYTHYNASGQTITGGESADFTVGATNIPRVTLPAIPAGATGTKVYLSDTSVGATTAGVVKKYYNKITSGTTLDLSSATWNEGTQAFAAAPAEPSANTTTSTIPRVTFPAIPAGATGYKIYLSNVSGSTVPADAAVKYFNKITTGTTYDLNAATWNEGTQTFTAAPAAPTSDTTGGGTARAIDVADNTLAASDPSWGFTTEAP